MHDADSHIMEPRDWLRDYVEPSLREQFLDVWKVGEPARDVETAVELHRDSEYRAEDAAQITLRKNLAATGSLVNDDRPAALDHLGFASQFVFDTFTSPEILRFVRDGRLELAVALARAQHRAVVD